MPLYEEKEYRVTTKKGCEGEWTVKQGKEKGTGPGMSN